MYLKKKNFQCNSDPADMACQQRPKIQTSSLTNWKDADTVVHDGR